MTLRDILILIGENNLVDVTINYSNELLSTVSGNPCELLKDLDEIQTCIMTEHQYHTDEANCTRRFFTKEWKEIYQMPQDEDVEA